MLIPSSNQCEAFACLKWGAPHFRHYVESGKMVSDEEKCRISSSSLRITHHFILSHILRLVFMGYYS